MLTCFFRANLQKLIVSGVGGKDQFVFRITQFRETSEFRDFRERVKFSSNGEGELPDLWFDLGFVEFLKDNYSILFRRMKLMIGRIQRSLERSPESFDVKQSYNFEGWSNCRWDCGERRFSRSIEICEFIGNTVEII